MMDIFEAKDLQDLDIAVFEEEAPEHAVITPKAPKTRRKSHMLKTSLTAIAVLFCFSLAIYGAGSFIEPKIHAYSLVIDGRSAGVFTSEEEADSVLTSYLEDLNEEYHLPLVFDENVEVEQVISRGRLCTTAAEAAPVVRTMLTPIVEGCGIYINGILCLAVDNENDAQLVLKAVKDHYAEDKAGVTSVDFVETVTIAAAQFDPAEIMPTDEAYDFLLTHEYAPTAYTVEKEGETLASVASHLDIAVNNLVDANQLPEEGMLAKGQIVYLDKPAKPLTVVVTRTETAMVPIAYQTKKIDNPDEYRGIEKVIQSGTDGSGSETYLLTETNGVQTGREIVASNVVVAANDYIIERGTKAVVATRYFNRTVSYKKKDIQQSFIWPLSGTLSSPFGKRSGTLHTGMDIACSKGTEVHAMADGVVVLAEYNGNYGYLIKVDHGNNLETWYAHLSKVKVKLGDVITQDQVIALSGNTGRSTGPHLHIEVRIDQVAYNPINYLP